MERPPAQPVPEPRLPLCPPLVRREALQLHGRGDRRAERAVRGAGDVHRAPLGHQAVAAGTPARPVAAGGGRGGVKPSSSRPPPSPRQQQQQKQQRHQRRPQRAASSPLSLEQSALRVAATCAYYGGSADPYAPEYSSPLERWRYQSELAGDHATSPDVVDVTELSRRAGMSWEVLRHGVPPRMGRGVAVLRCDFFGGGRGDGAGGNDLPAFLDLVAWRFPRLQHLTMRADGDGESDEIDSKATEMNDEIRAMCDKGSDKDGPLDTDVEDADVEEEAGEGMNSGLLRRLSRMAKAADRERRRMRRLYVLYRLPSLLSLDGRPVSHEERSVARPNDARRGTAVRGSDWLTGAMRPVSVGMGIGTDDFEGAAAGADDDESDPWTGRRVLSRRVSDSDDALSDGGPGSAVEVSIEGMARYESGPSASGNAGRRPQSGAHHLPPPYPMANVRTFPPPQGGVGDGDGDGDSEGKGPSPGKRLWKHRNRPVLDVDSSDDEEGGMDGGGALASGKITRRGRLLFPKPAGAPQVPPATMPDGPAPLERYHPWTERVKVDRAVDRCLSNDSSYAARHRRVLALDVAFRCKIYQGSLHIRRLSHKSIRLCLSSEERAPNLPSSALL